MGAWDGHKAPERASPRKPAQAAAKSSSPCQKPLSRGLYQDPQCWERGLLRAAQEVFCAARTAPAMKGLGCVSGEDAQAESFQAVSSPPNMTVDVTQEMVWHSWRRQRTVKINPLSVKLH